MDKASLVSSANAKQQVNAIEILELIMHRLTT